MPLRNPKLILILVGRYSLRVLVFVVSIREAANMRDRVSKKRDTFVEIQARINGLVTLRYLEPFH